MSVLTVTDVPDEIVAELRRRAVAHGLTMEDEVRQVLRDSVVPDNADGFKAHLLSLEYVVDDLPLPPRAVWPQRDIHLE